MRASIVGTGHYLPGSPISNEELIERHQLTIKSYFVRNRIGAETRHFAAPGQATSDLATEAAARAMEASGLPRSAIRRIVLATVSGDYPTPATACIVQRNLGMKGTAAIDIVGACSGFLQALDLGARCVVTGEGPVLVIGADIRSRQLDFTDLRTVFLYGDGAGAVVLAPSRGGDGIWHSLVTADGFGAEAVYIPAGGSREPVTCDAIRQHRHHITMKDGALVAGHARAGFREVVGRLSAESGVAVAEIAYFCIHQPNLFLVRQVLADLAIPAEKAWINFPRYGNTTSATIPIALSEAVAAGKLVPGEWLCLAAVGAGFAGAGQLVRWGGDVILVTGASQGIGYECARALLSRTSARVMITGRSAVRLDRARASMPSPERDRLVVEVSDQGNVGDTERLGGLLRDPGISLEAAILTVGSNPMYSEGPERLHTVDADVVDAVIRTNCTHTLRLTAAILERFRRQRSGVLIWIGSQAYKAGLPGAALYCASKAFLSGLAQAAHHEYAGRGVRVHLLNPGLVRTPRTAGVIDRFASRHGRSVDEAADVAARIVSLLLSTEPLPVEVDL